MKLNLFFIFLLPILSYSNDSIPTEIDFSFDNTYHSNTLSVHPFGIFMSRIQSNFHIKPEKKLTIGFNYSNGNVWLPYSRAYFPLEDSVRERIGMRPWHKRAYEFDSVNRPSELSSFEADGIIRSYQIHFTFPVGNQQELKVNTRIVSLDKGNAPYSLFTSDNFIEWFHSNIAGGEDPFARKYYGMNQAKIQYVDKNGREYKMENGDVKFSGIDIAYAWFPKLKILNNLNIYSNFGTQLGFNLSSVNPSVDLGLSASTIKRFNLKNKNQIRIGLAANGLLPNTLEWGNEAELSTKTLLLNFEGLLEFIQYYSNNCYISIAAVYSNQSAYFNADEYAYIILSGERITSHWATTFSHLYRRQTAQSLTVTLGKNEKAIWLYIREDLLVDNAPDAQIGIGIKHSF